jgi:hypothetical protein
MSSEFKEGIEVEVTANEPCLPSTILQTETSIQPTTMGRTRLRQHTARGAHPCIVHPPPPPTQTTTTGPGHESNQNVKNRSESGGAPHRSSLVAS